MVGRAKLRRLAILRFFLGGAGLDHHQEQQGPKRKGRFPTIFQEPLLLVLGSVIGSTVKSWNLPGAVLADAARDIASWSSMQRLGCSYGSLQQGICPPYS